MTLIDARKRFKARRTEPVKKRVGNKVLNDRLASVTDITPKAAKAREDDSFDTMVEEMSDDAETLHRRSKLLLEYAEVTRKRLGTLRKKD